MRANIQFCTPEVITINHQEGDHEKFPTTFSETDFRITAISVWVRPSTQGKPAKLFDSHVRQPLLESPGLLW